MKELSALIHEYLKPEGVIGAGIATIETLAGGPPSSDLTYVMPNAKAGVVFALPLNLDAIPDYLAKKDRTTYESDYIRQSSLGNGIAVKLANYLAAKGHPSTPLAVNEVYRDDNPGAGLEMYPPISLRYLAAASGVGFFGFSGNLLTKDYGAAIILGGLVTEAELIPDSPLDESENYCDDCFLCCGGCPSGSLHEQKRVTITMGGHSHSYGAKHGNLPCAFVCGGFSGLHHSGKWSTWATGRFPLPQTNEETVAVYQGNLDAFDKRPAAPGGRYHTMSQNKIYYVCSNCQLICNPDKEERKRRFKLLTHAGVIVQNEDGTLDAVTPEEARKRMDAMTPERRALYEGEIEPDTKALEKFKKLSLESTVLQGL
jgi:epoxyqueuosine reductase QueG